MDSLTHRWNIRSGEIVGSRVIKHERKYIDFIVSGKPLSEIFKTKEKDMISMFGWTSNIDYEKRTIKEFLKQVPAELETGRTIIYGCSECGDIGCGAITAEILEHGDFIIWRNFGYENNYDEIVFEGYKHIPQFEFEKTEYKNEFAMLAAELANTPRTKD